MSENKKTFHKTIDPSKTKHGASQQAAKSALPPGIQNLLARWNALPTKVRLYVGVSTFMVAFCADRYLTYTENQQKKGKVIVKQLGSLSSEQQT